MHLHPFLLLVYALQKASQSRVISEILEQMIYTYTPRPPICLYPKRGVSVYCVYTVDGNNIAGQKPYEFIGILIIMLKNHRNSYSF